MNAWREGAGKLWEDRKEKWQWAVFSKAGPVWLLRNRKRVRPAFTPHHPFSFLSSHTGYLRPLVINNFQMWLISLAYPIRHHVRSQRPTRGMISLFQQGITRDCTVAGLAWLPSLEPDPEGGRVALLGGGGGVRFMDSHGGERAVCSLYKIITKTHHTSPWTSPKHSNLHFLTCPHKIMLILHRNRYKESKTSYWMFNIC